MKIHIKKIRYITFNTNGTENTMPKVLSAAEERWMKHTIQDEVNSGISRLYRGEMLQVGGDVVWIEDFGCDVERDEKTEKRIVDAGAVSKARRTEWKETV